MIHYGRQSVSSDDVSHVTQVLNSDFLTQGPVVPRFESALAQRVHAKHAVTTNSATSALHVACLALGLEPGDYLWTSPNSFVASANCALYCGASVDFVDIDPLTYNMSAAALSEKLAVAEKNGTLPKVVVPVHFSGQSCQMQEIKLLADHYGFKVLEDASHALGAFYQKEPVGSCLFSDITVFSFHAIKMITTGEGGAAVTNEPELAHTMKSLRSHGINKSNSNRKAVNSAQWEYQQTRLGFNYRMTEFQAALGISQLQQLSEFLEKRTELANLYDQLLTDLGVVTPYMDPVNRSSWHLYVIQLEAHARQHVYNTLLSQCIAPNVHYLPIYKQPFYQQLGFEDNYCPEAEKYYKRCLTLPLHTQLSAADILTIARSLKDAIS